LLGCRKRDPKAVAGIRRIHGVDPRRVFFAVGQRLRVIFGVMFDIKSPPTEFDKFIYRNLGRRE
jgi:hypothetical protein